MVSPIGRWKSTASFPAKSTWYTSGLVLGFWRRTCRKKANRARGACVILPIDNTCALFWRQRSRVRVPLWSLDGFVLGCLEFSSSATLLNSQLVAFWQVRILVLLCSICLFLIVWMRCLHFHYKQTFKVLTLLWPFCLRFFQKQYAKYPLLLYGL